MIFEVVNDLGLALLNVPSVNGPDSNLSLFFLLGCSFQGLDGESDPNSIHGGCEVLAGEKWSATKWMRQRAAN